MIQEFRRDVQGLRALAVLPILIFHLKPTWCPGGFIGVDIFFVISGYLITRMILAEGDDFSFRRFYMRRFFRLYPALLATLIATLIAGWSILGPQDYLALAKSAVAAAFGVSNFHFYTAVDYFNAAAESHHLLHTWSLGVEEQFYLVWPLALLLARRWLGGVWTLVAVMAGVSIVALTLIQPRAPHLAFYMMPFRIFEFALGAALIAVEPAFRRAPAGAHTASGMIGAGILAAAFVLIDSETPWPGLWALVVAAATGLLILGGLGRVWQAILGLAPLVFIGRISYSLYLVHWPLITLYKHHAVTEPGRLELLVLGLVALAAAVVLHFGIEETFRQKGRTARESATASPAFALRLSARLGACVLVVSSLGLLAFSAYAIRTDGVPQRLDRGKAQFLDKGLTFAGDICSNRRSRCQIGDREAKRVVYIIGDSYAMNLFYGLDQFLREHKVKGIAFYDNGCLFLAGTKRFIRGAGDEKCRRNIAEAYTHLGTTTAPVILAGNFLGYRNTIGPADASAPLRQSEAEYYAWIGARLADSMKALSAEKRTVVLVKQTYSTGIDLPKCLSQPGVAEDAKVAQTKCAPWPLNEAAKAAAPADAAIEAVAQAFPKAVVVDPKPVFCPSEPCVTGDGRELYFRDAAHLTTAGSVFLIRGLEAALKQHVFKD